MLKNTRAVLHDTFKKLNFLKEIVSAIPVISVVWNLIYRFYGLITKGGFWKVSCAILFVAALISFGAFLYLVSFKFKKRKKKEIKKRISLIINWLKRSSNILVVLYVIFGLAIGIDYGMIDFLTFFIAVAFLAIEGFVYLIVFLIEKRINLIKNAFEIDMKELNPLQRFKKDEEKEELPQNLQNIVESFEKDKEKKERRNKRKN